MIRLEFGTQGWRGHVRCDVCGKEAIGSAFQEERDVAEAIARAVAPFMGYGMRRDAGGHPGHDCTACQSHVSNPYLPLPETAR